MTYPIHQACAKWPRPSTADFEALVADIRAKGLLNAVWLTEQGEILEGKVRYEACLQAGVEPRFETYTGNDPIGFTISHNKLRRHLSTTQLAFIGEELAKLKVGRPNIEVATSISSGNPRTATKIAQQLGIRRESINDARALKKYGEPNIVELVTSNQVGLSTAAKYARHTPREEQRTADRKTVKNQGHQIRSPGKNSTPGKPMSPRMKTMFKAKRDYSGPKFSSQQWQELNEKLHPLIKRLRHQSKQHITLFCPHELECIAFDIEKLLAQWTNTETSASVKQASGN